MFCWLWISFHVQSCSLVYELLWPSKSERCHDMWCMPAPCVVVSMLCRVHSHMYAKLSATAIQNLNFIYTNMNIYIYISSVLWAWKLFISWKHKEALTLFLVLTYRENVTWFCFFPLLRIIIEYSKLIVGFLASLLSTVSWLFDFLSFALYMLHKELVTRTFLIMRYEIYLVSNFLFINFFYYFLEI
jgi:hypothetical protein